MNVLDEEVFAVVLAISVVGSVLASALVLRPEVVEPFTALGLLDSSCRIGEYPREVYPGEEVELCVYVYNHMGYPILAQVRYKVVEPEDLPTNTTPSRAPTFKSITVLVPHRREVLRKVKLVIPPDTPRGEKVALVLELWLYDVRTSEWTYSGRWNHLYVRVLGVEFA
ncbi:MAG: DUF1616 domain-containing protein [Sulfolobales archaeon]